MSINTQSESVHANDGRKLYLLGAGGHCKVVFDALQVSKYSGPIGVLDGNAARAGERFMDSVDIEVIDQTSLDSQWVHIAIGDNHIRAKIYQKALNDGATGYRVIHPNSQIAATCEIGHGTLVAAQAVIGPQALVGCAVIVNHGAIVDHDCEVGDYSHISPNATLGGGVSIGENVLVGAGAVVLPCVSICANSIIGAGAVITKHIEKPGVYVGAPAKWVRDI